MPGYSCSVKERMLYSSCKASVTAVCEQHLNMEIDRKVRLLLFLFSTSKKITTFNRILTTTLMLVCHLVLLYQIIQDAELDYGHGLGEGVCL